MRIRKQQGSGTFLAVFIFFGVEKHVRAEGA